LKNNTFRAEDQPGLVSFQEELNSVGREANAIDNKFNALNKTIGELKAGIRNTPGTDLTKLAEIRALEERMMKLDIMMNGDGSLKKREFETPPSLNDRFGGTVWNSWYSTNAPTAMQKENLEIVKEAMPSIKQELKNIEAEVEKLKVYFYSVGGPFLEGDME
jgi:hypothetical protein